MMRLKRVGHGELDPAATGVLPIAWVVTGCWQFHAAVMGVLLSQATI